MQMAEDIFVESLKVLSQEAAKAGIDLLIENNVLEPFNLVNSKNELLLCVTSDDLLRIIEKTAADNVYILLDVSHLKISANSLRFSSESFIRDVASYVKAVHLSDNNGVRDINKPITEEQIKGIFNAILLVKDNIENEGLLE